MDKSCKGTSVVKRTVYSIVPAQTSLLYFEALTRHGVPASLHVYPEGGHGFAFGNGQGLVEEWTSLLLSWLNTF